MDMNELLRRDVIRLIGLGGAGLMVGPGPALGQAKTPFRMDETNAIHFMAGHFMPRFLTKPIEWEFKQFATSGQGRVAAFMRGAVDKEPESVKAQWPNGPTSAAMRSASFASRARSTLW